jgi:HEAT repeat protein
VSDRDRDGSSEDRRVAVQAASERPGPGAVAKVAEGLADSDWRVRKEAAAAAGKLGNDPSLLSVLVGALLQPDDVGLRNAAIEAFGYVGPRGAKALIASLERAPATARKFVCAAMGGCGPECVPALAALARDPDPNTATVALESLARIGGSGAEAALREHLAAGDWVVRLAALEGLSQLGARVPVATLAPMVEDPLLRRFALRLLGRSSDPASVAPLARGLSIPTSTTELVEIVAALEAIHESTSVGADAVASAARSFGIADRAGLRALVSDDDPIAARAAALLLLLARDADALPAIAALAARAELGPSALAALRSFGAAAVRPLLAIAPSLDGPARAWALEVAAELAAHVGTGSSSVPAPSPDPALAREVRLALRVGLEARDSNVVRAAARSLSHFAEPEDATLLVKLGAEHGGAVARAAGSALEALSVSAPRSIAAALDAASPDGAEGWSAAIAALPADAALEKLLAAISSGEVAARRAALLALDRVDGAEAAEAAAVAIADEDVDVRVAAVSVLARMKDPAAREIAGRTLRVALREESAPVRAAAARSLGALGDRTAVGVLKELLRDPGPGVALAALSAMRALGGSEPPNAPDLEELLVDTLGHPDEEVVKEGLRAVAESRIDRKEARLAVGLSHAAWDVRRLAASLLGAIGSVEARARLEERAALESDDLVKRAISAALRGAREA